MSYQNWHLIRLQLIVSNSSPYFYLLLKLFIVYQVFLCFIIFVQLPQMLQNQKIVQCLEKKMEEDQIIVGIEPAFRIIKVGKKLQYHVAITSKCVYYINNLSIMIKQKLEGIQTITISAVSNQIIIHNFSEQQPWLQSQTRTRILKNFLVAKQKFLKNKQPFPVNIQMNSSLENALPKIRNKARKVLKSIFKLGNNDSSTIKDFQMRESDTFHIINVKQKDFKLKIGATIYDILYQNIKLLYTSGSMGFRFDEQKYMIESQTSNKIIYKEKTTQQQISPTKLTKKSNSLPTAKVQAQKLMNSQRIYLRRINKGNQSVDQCISNMLKNYRSPQYKQEILFAIQSQTHFQIITKYQNNYDQLLSFGQQILQLEIRSIFHRIINLIEGKSANDMNSKNLIKSSQLIETSEVIDESSKAQQNKFSTQKQINLVPSWSSGSIQFYESRILYSLSPENIFFDEQRRPIISEIFSSIQKHRVLQYMAPQQFFQDVDSFSVTQIELINLWKAGILIYQLAYGNTPFCIDYIAQCVKNRIPIKVSFPPRDRRSTALQNLIRSLLVIKPQHRAGLGNQHWKTKLMKQKWMA